jgi:[ribosomal protein S18]-alanine N-acetyltransferase
LSAQPKSLLRCREMLRGDLPVVLEIEREAYEFPWSEGIFRDCLRMGYSSWVATNTLDEILGYGLMSYAMDEAHILNICVSQASRRYGIGAYLLEHLMGQAGQRNVDWLLLEVRKSNQAAISLYQKAGFHEIGERRNYYPARKGREDALVLGRHL